MRKAVKSTKRAFTLLELIIAMAIIAVLMGLGVFAITKAQVSSRDSQRVSALNDVSVAIEQIYQNYGTYPSAYTLKKAVNGTGSITFTVPNAPAGSTVPTVSLKGPAAPAATTSNGTTSSATQFCVGVDPTYATYVIGVQTEGAQTWQYKGSYATVNCKGVAGT